jgi:hypothetical protein
LKTPKKKSVLISLSVAAVLAVLVLGTADYSNQAGIHRISHAPFFTIDAGRSERWIVQRGINVVSDRGTGQAGNVIEFPILPGYRVGVRYFSRRWWREAHAK